MEGNLWKATWEKHGRSYELALVEHPSVRAHGRSLEEAVENLEDMVAERFGDAVPHLEFVRPLPTKHKGEHEAFLFVLAAHEPVTKITNVPKLFSHQCAACGQFVGPRTEDLIMLDEIPAGDLVFTDWLGHIISSKFSDLLHLGACPEIRLLPTMIGGRKTNDFLELASLHVRPFVGIKGNQPANRSKCKDCGFAVALYMPHEAPFLQYVNRRDLPIPRPDVFPVGSDHRMELAVSRRTRDQVICSKSIKNVVSQKIGILPHEKAIPLDQLFV